MWVLLIDVILCVYIISFLMVLLALYTFSLKICSRPLPTDLMLLNLIVCNLLLLLCLPQKWFEATYCKTWTSIDFFRCTSYASCLLLMAVGVVRISAVVFPVTCRRLHGLVCSLTCSAVALPVSVIYCNTFATHYSPPLDEQLLILLTVRLEFSSALCLIPLFMGVFSSRQKQKAVGVALSTLAFFLVFTLPHKLTQVLGSVPRQSSVWQNYTLLLSLLNTCLDLVIVYFSSSAFRAQTHKTIFLEKKQLPNSVSVV